MLLRDGQELIDPAQEPVGVLLIGQVVQEHAHRVHADGRRPSELEIDARRIERAACHISSSLMAVAGT